MKVLLLFVLVPLVETFLLAKIGAAIGWMYTIILVIVTGIVGGWLARLEGARAWRRYSEALARGQMPEEGVLSGLLLLIGGALLITPGVLTDVVGLLLLIPATRRLVASYIRPRIEQRFRDATVTHGERMRVVHFEATAPFGAPFEGQAPVDSGSREVLDADFEIRDRAPSQIEGDGAGGDE